jgi:hypothetical protein
MFEVSVRGRAIAVAMALLFGFPTAMQAQTAEDIAALNRQVLQLYGQGKYSEAAALAEQAMAKVERMLGPEHPLTLTSVSNLAAHYYAQGDWARASDHWRRLDKAPELPALLLGLTSFSFPSGFRPAHRAPNDPGSLSCLIGSKSHKTSNLRPKGRRLL